MLLGITEQRSFQGIQVNLYGLLEKSDITYPSELTILNLKSQVAELAQRLRIMMEILELSGNQQFPTKSPGMESLYNRGRGLFHLLAGEA